MNQADMTNTAEMTAQDITRPPAIRGWLAGIFLLLSVLVSALAVIEITHINRQLFSAYQGLLDGRDEMEVQWSQLLLEQSALAAHARVERVATTGLNMRVPAADEIVMVVR